MTKEVGVLSEGIYTLINKTDKSHNFTAQNLLSENVKWVTQEDNDFLYRIAQPPNGLPANKNESSIPLTPTYAKSLEISPIL